MIPAQFRSLGPLFNSAFSWEAWEQLLARNTIVIERPAGRPHPAHPTIIYPLDYGYVADTIGSDGEPVDVFVGSASTGLCALLTTQDFMRNDREVKLLYNVSPQEIYLAYGFMNYAPDLLRANLVMRYPMHTIWAQVNGRSSLKLQQQ